MDKDKLNETLIKHKQWLDGLPDGNQADLQDADLRYERLQGAHLQYADLRGAHLQDADLQGAHLQYAHLRGAHLQDADLRGADLRGAHLRGAYLRGAQLQNARLQVADLRNANLRNANLRNADLEHVDLQDADLQFADLQGANLDFSCWPLWCGSLDVKVDARIARQLAYHFCRLDCDDPEYQAAREAIKDFANKFHRAEECGEMQEIKGQIQVGDLLEGEDGE